MCVQRGRKYQIKINHIQLINHFCVRNALKYMKSWDSIIYARISEMYFKQICFCNVLLKRFKTRFIITNIAYSFILYCLDKNNFDIKYAFSTYEIIIFKFLNCSNMNITNIDIHNLTISSAMNQIMYLPKIVELLFSVSSKILILQIIH